MTNRRAPRQGRRRVGVALSLSLALHLLALGLVAYHGRSRGPCRGALRPQPRTSPLLSGPRPPAELPVLQVLPVYNLGITLTREGSREARIDGGVEAVDPALDGVKTSIYRIVTEDLTWQMALS